MGVATSSSESFSDEPPVKDEEVSSTAVLKVSLLSQGSQGPIVCPRYEPGAYDEANESARSRYSDEIWSVDFFKALSRIIIAGTRIRGKNSPPHRNLLSHIRLEWSLRRPSSTRFHS